MKDEIKLGCLTIVVIFFISIVGFGVKVLFFPVHAANKAADTAYQITDKVLNADNVLQNYEFFKQQYQDYKALKNTVELSKTQINDYKASLPSERTKWSEADKNELDRLNIVLAGQKQQLNNIAAEYNAKSQMQNRSLFKTKDLPYELPYEN